MYLYLGAFVIGLPYMMIGAINIWFITNLVYIFGMADLIYETTMKRLIEHALRKHANFNIGQNYSNNRLL